MNCKSLGLYRKIRIYKLMNKMQNQDATLIQMGSKNYMNKFENITVEISAGVNLRNLF